jgi:alkaline phosphatase D
MISAFCAREAFARHPSAMTNRISTIAFGSCSKQWRPQEYWKTIQFLQPDLWIWLGDSVYIDTKDMDTMRHRYAGMYTNPTYQTFRESVDIIGIWDDHDYGENGGGSWYPKRSESQAALLDFLDEPADSPRRDQAGVYTSYDFGPSGAHLRIILLDTRYHAERPGPGSDLLGEAQWTFLETALTNSNAQLLILGSSIQVIPKDHRFEKWSDWPESRERILQLIHDSNVPGVLLISGDRHIHELSIYDRGDGPYPLLELTSSGLTHAWKKFPGEKNRFRFGEVLTNDGFGIIQIEWDAVLPTVSLQIRDMEGVVRSRMDLPLSALSPTREGPPVEPVNSD